MVQAIVEISEPSNRVLNMIKAKYGLKTKSEALNKFIEVYADEFLEISANEELVKEVINSCNKHMKKYPRRKMSLKQLDAL